MSNYHNFNIVPESSFTSNDNHQESKLIDQSSFRSPEELRRYLDYLQEVYNNTGNELVSD